jgi:hypothetical protein
MSVLQELLVDLEKSYTEAENQTDNYMELLDDDKDARKIKELHNDMEVLYRELYDIKSWMSRQKDKFLETRTVPLLLYVTHYHLGTTLTQTDLVRRRHHMSFIIPFKTWIVSYISREYGSIKFLNF